jgi:ketosteroid isomerase-like protein
MVTSDLDPDTEELARRFVGCIESGDVDGVAACFSEDAVVWHNEDDLVVPVERVLRVLSWLATNVRGLRYEVSRRRAVSDGFVQKHVVRGTGPDGSELAFPACLVVRVDHGRIARIDEYFDSAGIVALRR